MNQAVIVCGGEGSRLEKNGVYIPKSLIDIDGVPLIVRQILTLCNYGFSEFLLLAGSKSDEIQKCIKETQFASEISIKFVVEKTKMGTGGALINAIDNLQDQFVLLYGDIYFNADLHPLIDSLKESVELSILVRPTDHKFDSNLVSTDLDHRVTEVHLHPHDSKLLIRNRAITGIYAVRKSVITRVINQFPNGCDFDREVLPHLCNMKSNMTATRGVGLIMDVGTVDRIARVKELLPTLSNLFKPAVFLDRDGVVNRLNNHILSHQDFHILHGVPDAVATIRKKGYRIFVITNQPSVAKGHLEWKELEKIHSLMENKVAALGGWFDDIYVCPHYPDSGFEGEISSLKISCDCRKPGTKMIVDALAKFSTDVSNSWVVGDQITDELAAQRMNIPFARILNEGVETDWINESPTFESLLAFSKFLPSFEDSLKK